MMSATAGMHTKAADKPCGLSADPAKALVMSSIGELVTRGHAEWRTLRNGDVELRLATGEVFLLGDQSVTRTA